MQSLGRALFAAALVLAGARGADADVKFASTRAEEVVKKAQAALGGEERIRAVQGLSVRGKYRRVVQEREMSGEREFDFLLPDKFMRTDSFVVGGLGTSVTTSRAVSGGEFWSSGSGGRGGVIVMRGDGGPREPTKEEREEADRRQAKMMRAEMARYLLALLLTPPADIPVEFAYAGEAVADDGSADVVDATGPEGFAARLFLDKETHLPLMLTFRAPKPRVMTMTMQPGHGGGRKPEELEKEAQEKLRAEGPAAPEEVEMQWRFSDYRRAGGLALPHRITAGADGETSEEWEIKGYSINPQFKADKFQKK